MDEQTATAPEGAGSYQISRRTVIRTAAHAVWAVPVISAVSAAPAFASSDDKLTFFVGPTTTKTANKTLQLTLTVKNNSFLDTTVGLLVVVDFPSTYTSPALQGSATGNWLAPSVSGNTFSFSASQQIGAGGTSGLTFTIKTQNNAPATTPTTSIKVTATATGADNVPTKPFTGASDVNVSAVAL